RFASEPADVKIVCVSVGSYDGFDLNFCQPNQPPAASTTTARMVTITPIGAPRVILALTGAGAGAALDVLGAAVGAASGGANGSYEPLSPRSSSKISVFGADDGVGA